VLWLLQAAYPDAGEDPAGARRVAMHASTLRGSMRTSCSLTLISSTAPGAAETL
jgi:hypothetical protein